MDRRKFMIGFGGTVIGTGALLGSGAFTSFSADRSANVAVADDSAAYLGLDATTTAGSYEGTIDSSLVTMNGDSELAIALDGSVADGDGVNDNAFMQLGEITTGDSPDPRDSANTDNPGNNDLVAFVISNQFDQTIDLNVEDDESSDGILKLPYIVLDTADDTVFDSGADLTGTTVTGLLQSHEIHVVVQVDTQVASNLSGNEVNTLTLSATPN